MAVRHSRRDRRFSRMIVFLRCSTNNRASTVFDAFQSAVEKFGLPSRVRSDKGKENTDVAWFITRAGSWKPHYRTKCPQPENREVVEGHVPWVYICLLPFVLLYGSMRSSRHHKRASFWLHSIMCSYPVLTETCPCLPRVTTGDHLVLSITNRQNNYGLEECCQIPLEELHELQ